MPAAFFSPLYSASPMQIWQVQVCVVLEFSSVYKDQGDYFLCSVFRNEGQTGIRSSSVHQPFDNSSEEGNLEKGLEAPTTSNHTERQLVRQS